MIGLTRDINGLIDDLYKLFPPPEEKQAELTKAELDKLTEVLRELKFVVKEQDPTLGSAMQLLNQQVRQTHRTLHQQRLTQARTI